MGHWARPPSREMTTTDTCGDPCAPQSLASEEQAGPNLPNPADRQLVNTAQPSEERPGASAWLPENSREL